MQLLDIQRGCHAEGQPTQRLADVGTWCDEPPGAERPRGRVEQHPPEGAKGQAAELACRSEELTRRGQGERSGPSDGVSTCEGSAPGKVPQEEQPMLAGVKGRPLMVDVAQPVKAVRLARRPGAASRRRLGRRVRPSRVGPLGT